MNKEKPVKNIIGTIAAALVVLALIISCAVFGASPLSADQLAALRALLIVCACSIAYCFIAGELSGNFSQMDKLWSVLPIAYAWIIAVRGGMSARLTVYALIVTAWGVRLMFNFARKGAYRLRLWTGNEDYRWSIVRSGRFFRRGFIWTLFDLCFISAYQNILALAITLPSLACMGSDAPFGVWDAAAAAAAVMFMMLETAADEYQWKFHQTKKRLLEKGGALADLPAPYDLGFNTTGPWAYMRHPNYLGEQGIWLSLYFFTLGAGVTRGIFHWSMIGPLLLILLFMGSSALAESISASKYLMYADYMDRVHKYLPIHRYERGDKRRVEPEPAAGPVA